MLSLSLDGEELLHGNRIRRAINDNESIMADETTEKAESVTELTAPGSEANKANKTDKTKTGEVSDSGQPEDDQSDEFKQEQLQQNLDMSKTKDNPIVEAKLSKNNTETMGGDSLSVDAAAGDDGKPVTNEEPNEKETSAPSAEEKLEQTGDDAAAEVDAKNSTFTSSANAENAVNDVTEKLPLDKEGEGTDENKATADGDIPHVDDKANEGQSEDDDAQREPVETTTASSTGDGEFVCGVVRPFVVLDAAQYTLCMSA